LLVLRVFDEQVRIRKKWLTFNGPGSITSEVMTVLLSVPFSEPKEEKMTSALANCSARRVRFLSSSPMVWLFSRPYWTQGELTKASVSTSFKVERLPNISMKATEVVAMVAALVTGTVTKMEPLANLLASGARVPHWVRM